MMSDEQATSIKSLVGEGYHDFWHSQKRYVVCKGGRASKKSTTAALKLIVRMMQYPLSNALVLRRVAENLRDSCHAQLRWAIDRLGVSHMWAARYSPLELEYLPTGQKILFRGLEEPERIKSIMVKRGHINFAWLEEASEVDEQDFDVIDRSLRGKMPDGYYVQWLITFNPVNANSWLKSRFFDVDDPDVLALTTNYLCNEWLSDDDKRLYDKLKETDPDAYSVDGLGELGVGQGQYFRQWRDSLHVVDPFTIPANWHKFRSMDWGSARPYACYWWAVDFDGNMYAYRELYGWGGKPNVGTQETARQVGAKIASLESKSEDVHGGVLDNACWARTGVTGPSIAEELNAELYKHGLLTFSKSSKGREDGANALKQRLIGNKQADGSYKPAIYFFRTCKHAIRTIPMLEHDEHKPETYDTKGEDHAADAVIYGVLSRPWTPTEPVKPKPIDPWLRHRKERESNYSAWAS